MYIGVDYYPEHWPHERWETDVRLMQEAGFNIVRLAEFAWVNMEPEEGRFEFGWLDDALGILGRHGISVILGTPTATMPAWVARKYPEALALQTVGKRLAWGVRKNNCFTSGAYRLLSERITRAMAAHFAATPNVIGWQTDNEFGEPFCFCSSCRSGFQEWLQEKYETLDHLNRAWGTHFWGQRYGHWAEIQLPEPPQANWAVVGNSILSTHNPSLCLDYMRFNSWLNVRFQRDQVKILRAACPNHFITHNFMGLFSDLDYYALAEDLDHVSWDNYPVWGEPDIPYYAAAAADVMRGLKRKNVWIMEQTAGPGGWSSFGRNPRPGEIRKIAYQQLANGADHIIWFRWRTCTAGREQYWHGLLGHDGKPLPPLSRGGPSRRRIPSPGRRIERHDHPDRRGDGLRLRQHLGPPHSTRLRQELLPRGDRPLSARPVPGRVAVDMIPSSQDFSPYRILIAPELFLLTDAVAERLREFVAAGGILITELRTGVKDETNLCYDRTLPGLLTDTLGIVIEEYETLGGETAFKVIGKEAVVGEFTAAHFADWVLPQSAKVLAGYEQWHLEPYAAATRNHFGQGTAYYVGTVLKEESFYDALVADALQRAQVQPALIPPAGVEVTVRKNDQRALLFLVNHTEEKQTVSVPAGKQELLTGTTTGETLELDRYGVAVVKLA